MAAREAAALARGYYRAIDDGDYAALADLLTPQFHQVRGDRRLEGRERFVRFMRDERPATDTTHAVDAVYRRDDGPDGDAESGEGGAPDEAAAEVAVRGRLRRADGTVGFGFVDVFRVEDGRLDRLVTYTNSRVE